MEKSPNTLIRSMMRKCVWSRSVNGAMMRYSGSYICSRRTCPTPPSLPLSWLVDFVGCVLYARLQLLKHTVARLCLFFDSKAVVLQVNISTSSASLLVFSPSCLDHLDYPATASLPGQSSLPNKPRDTAAVSTSRNGVFTGALRLKVLHISSTASCFLNSPEEIQYSPLSPESH